MSIKHLFDQFMGSAGAQGAIDSLMGQSGTSEASADKSTHSGNGIGGISGTGFPGGVAGGLAAGGIVSLLMGSKKARKYAGKAATIGGAAMLGGAAYKLYQNWQQNQQQNTTAPVASTSQEPAPLPNTLQTQATEGYQLTLIKAMIASAKADGHIDSDEQQKIFEAVETLALPADEKGMIFDLLSKPISVMDIAQGVDNIEQKTEVYLASCLVGEMDHPAERSHLDQLATVLNLPAELKTNIEQQVSQGIIQ